MRNFLRIAENIDTLPILNAIAIQPDLWNENTLRTTHPGTPHADVDDIWVFFNVIDPEDPAKALDDINVVPYRGWYSLPQVRPIIFGLMHQVGGIQLGRVIITRLAPGKSITPHADAGMAVAYYKRYQIALQSLPGANFHCGGESVNFKTGEVWFVRNDLEHAVENNSAADRLVMIADVRSA